MSSRDSMTIEVEPPETEKQPLPRYNPAPTPRPDRARKLVLSAVIGLVAVLVVGFFLLRSTRSATSAAGGPTAPAAPGANLAPVSISTAVVAIREIPVTIEANGPMTPFELTDIAPQVPGYVASTKVEAGDYVKKGQVLAVLDDRDARLRVKQAEAALTQAQANLKQARANLGIDGDQALNPERVAEVESAKANYNLAIAHERRYRLLLESGDVPQAQYDEFKARLETAQKTYEAAVARARSGGAGIDAAESAVSAARVQLDMAKKALADTVITAPLSGHIQDRPTAIGEWVTTSSKIVSIVQSDRLKLAVQVSEADSSRIKLGMPVSIWVDAYPGEEFHGVVGAILPSLDSQGRSLTVVVGVLNGDARLKPGMFATTKIVDSVQGRSVAVVPQSAVVKTVTGSSQVYVIRDNRAIARIVQTGPAFDGFVPIYSGVAEGEEVTTDGAESLFDGAQIVKTTK